MTNQRSNISKHSIVLSFIILFIYGCLLLMIGYTQSGLSHAIFGDNKNAGGYMVYLLVAQSAGLIIATLIIGRLLSKVNIRWMFLTGFIVAAIMVTLISQFSVLFPIGSTTLAARVVCFAIFSLIFGISIGPMSPLVSTLLSAVYVGHKRTTMLSVSNGIYGIGAGILPLAFAGVIIKTSANSDFSSVQPFYYAAIGLAIIAAICGFFVNYKHSAQLTSSKIIDKTEKSFNIWKPLIFAIILMSAYMITETIVNYMFTNVATQSRIGLTDAKKNATMAFGLFVMVQGLWRAGSGLFVTPRTKNWTFIFLSAIVVIAAFVWMVAGGLQTTWSTFVIAFLLGIGIGNLWPVIYSYAIDIDDRRASFIGIVINIVSMFWIPITQIICGILWTSGQNEGASNPLFLATLILGLMGAIAVIVLVSASFVYYRNHNIIKKDKSNKFIQFTQAGK